LTSFEREERTERTERTEGSRRVCCGVKEGHRALSRL
jgi:hypothetical protein